MNLAVEYLDHSTDEYVIVVPEGGKFVERDHVDSGRMEFVALDADGEIFDSVTIKNNPQLKGWRLQDESVREPVAA